MGIIIAALTWVFWVLLLIILAALVVLAARLGKWGSSSGSGSGSSAGTQAVQEATAILQSISDDEREASEAECRDLKRLYETAQAEGVSAVQLTPLLTAIENLCPGN